MMTVKAIRHHQSFAGRDADDAHAQYLSLTTETKQVINSDLDLNHHRLEVSMIIGDRRSFVIRPCDECGSGMSLRGGQGMAGRKGADIFIQTIYNCASCGAGDIIIEAYAGGAICICADELCVIATDVKFFNESFLVCAPQISLCAEEDVELRSPNGGITLSADDIFLDADEITIDANLESCGTARFVALKICEWGCDPQGSLLRLHNTCDTVGSPGDSCVPMIDFLGCEYDSYSQCAPIWNGGSTGKNQAKYCLDGGIFINVNGCHRYIKFHRPLP